MVGNMLISGRNSGQVRLAIHGPGNFQAIATKVDVTLQDVIKDVEMKLGELKASPSPIETEIKFVEAWLKNAYESIKSEIEPASPSSDPAPTPTAAPPLASSPSLPSNVTPISPAASTTSPTGDSKKVN